MLKLNLDPQFTADVSITVPGQEQSGTITLTFKYRSRKEIIDFFEKNKDKENVEVFKEMVVGWSGIDAEFNKKNVEIFLDNYPAATVEILGEYSRLSLASRVKN